MERLTTNKDVSEMGMWELAHNSCYIDENRSARYRDFETDIDARELTRNIMRTFGFWEIDDDVMYSDELFDEVIIDNLMYGTEDLEGLVALFYRNLWAMAELREWLKAYEDAEEQGLLLRLPCKVGDTVYRITSANTKIVEDEVLWFEKYGTNNPIVVLKEYGDVSAIRFGKTVFLTKEEAEKALQALKEGVKNE